MPILALKKSTDWDSTIYAVENTINSHTRITLFPREEASAISRLLLDQWPSGRRQAIAREVVEPHVRSGSGQVFRVEAVATDRITRRKR